MSFTPVQYPRAQVLYLPAIKERVPVFEGRFRLTQDVDVSSAAAFSSALGPDGKTVTINGRLDYQACDSKICYLPTSVPVRRGHVRDPRHLVNCRNCWINATIVSAASSWQKWPAFGSVTIGPEGNSALKSAICCSGAMARS